jgi:hypothetical protein
MACPRDFNSVVTDKNFTPDALEFMFAPKQALNRGMRAVRLPFVTV